MLPYRNRRNEDVYYFGFFNYYMGFGVPSRGPCKKTLVEKTKTKPVKDI